MFRRGRRHTRADELKARFINGPLGLVDDESSWRAVRILGAGGQGHAGLWFCVDKSEKIVDRLVCKESVGTGGFNNPRNWLNGDVNDLPLEAVMNDIVTVGPVEANNTSATSSYNVTYRGAVVDRIGRTYRIYQDYCAYGDINSLIQAQAGPR